MDRDAGDDGVASADGNPAIGPETQYETLVNAIPNGLFQYDADGRIVTINDSLLDATGRSRDEVIGAPIAELFGDEATRLVAARRGLVGSTAETVTLSSTLEADGATRPCSIELSLVSNDESLDAVGIVRLTPNREPEQAIRGERDLLEKLLDTSPVGIAVLDGRGVVLEANTRAEELLGLSTSELEGRAYDEPEWDIYDENGEPITPTEFPVTHVLQTEEPAYRVEYGMTLPDGSERWFASNAAPVFDQNGALERIVVTFDDVTQLKEQARWLERQRDDLESELEDVLGRIEDGFYGLDENFRVTYVNERAETLFGLDESAMIGRDVRETIEFTDDFEAALNEALDGQEPVFLEDYYEPFDTWFDNAIYPSETGVSVYLRDVTERKEREQELERYETIVETVNDGIYVVNEQGQFTMVNDEYASMTGYDRDELLGAHVSLVVDDSTAERARAIRDSVGAGECEDPTLEADLWTARGEAIRAEATFALLEGDDHVERIGVVRDVTERVERERELQTRIEQQETVTTLGRIALSERDLDGLFTEAASRIAETLDIDYCKVLERQPDGTHFSFRAGVGWHGSTMDATVPNTHETQAGHALHSNDPQVVENWHEESRFVRSDLLVDHGVTSGISTVVGPPDNPWGVLGVHATDAREFSTHDVNFVQSIATILATAIERADYERELERYQTIVETVNDGLYALDPDGDFVFVNDTFCEMTGYDREELLGNPGKLVHNDEVDAKAARFSAEVISGERETAMMAFDLRTADGRTVPVESRFGPYPYDEERYGRTGVVRDVTDHLEREETLRRQREELAALNRLNDIVRELSHSVVESSSRDEIETLVCERLADSEPYRFAWIGEADAASGTVAVRTEAGTQGYLDSRPLPVDPGEFGDGPTARAIRTHEPQIVSDVQSDPQYEPWRNRAERHGIRSTAAIPIGYEDALYGVLNVYSGQVGAFDGREGTILTKLGHVVGHAINALERKEALLSDQVVEVDFRLQDAFEFADGTTASDGTVTFDRTVSIDDGTYLEYGTATGGAIDLVADLVETVPHWDELTILDDRFGTVRFELRLVEPPVVMAIAAHGGRIKRAVIEDGDYWTTVELPPGVDVRTVVQVIQTEYPGTDLIAQRRTSRENGPNGRIDPALADVLTERQRTILEAAYFAGYFDTPRKRSGEEVATSLGITAPTLHQHIRKGQRSVLAALFEDDVWL